MQGGQIGTLKELRINTLLDPNGWCQFQCLHFHVLEKSVRRHVQYSILSNLFHCRYSADASNKVWNIKNVKFVKVGEVEVLPSSSDSLRTDGALDKTSFISSCAA